MTRRFHDVGTGGGWLVRAGLGVIAMACAIATVFHPAVAQDSAGAGPGPVPERTGDVRATVRVRTTDVGGKPVAGVRIRLADGDREIAAAVSDEEGRAILASVPRRDLRVTASADGRSPVDAVVGADEARGPRVKTHGTAFATRIELVAGGGDEGPLLRLVLQPLRTVDVTGAPPGAVVTGVVVASEFEMDARPGVDFRMVAAGSERLLGRMTSTATDEGRCNFPGVPEGATLVVRAAPDGSYVPAVAVEVDDDGGTARLSDATRALVVRGAVRDTAGKPVPGARVHAAPAAVPQALARPDRPPESRARGTEGVVLAWTVTTDAAGGFALSSLDPAVPHALRAEGPVGGPQLLSAVLWDVAATATPDPVTADLTLIPVATFSGMLSDGSKPLPASAEIRIVTLPRHDGAEREVTTRDGTFRFDSLVPGKFRVFARGDGFLPTVLTVEVPPTGLAAFALAVDAGHAIEGRVVDPEGKPVAGAAVHATDPESEAQQVIRYPIGEQHADSAADGSFRITGLRDRDWNFRVLVQDGQATEVVRVRAPSKDVVVRTGPCPRLRFAVRYPEGLTSSDIRLGVFRRVGDGTPYAAGRLDRAACTETLAAFCDLPSDEDLIVRFALRGHPPFMQTIRLLPGEVRDLGTLAPPEPCVLEGIVTDESGAALEGVDVRTELAEGESTTDAEGRFRLENVAPGRQRVRGMRFRRDGRRWAETEVNVPAPADLRIVARADVRLEGRVLRSDGTPCAATVSVQAVRPWGQIRRPEHTESQPKDGTFHMDVTPGPYTVRIFDASGDAPVLERRIEIDADSEEPIDFVIPRR